MGTTNANAIWIVATLFTKVVAVDQRAMCIAWLLARTLPKDCQNMPKANEHGPPIYTLQHAVHETRSTEANVSNNTGSAVLAPHGALGWWLADFMSHSIPASQRGIGETTVCTANWQHTTMLQVYRRNEHFFHACSTPNFCLSFSILRYCLRTVTDASRMV